MRFRTHLAVLLIVVGFTSQGCAPVASRDAEPVVYCVPSYDDHAEAVSEVFILSVGNKSAESLGTIPGHPTSITWLGKDRFALGEGKGGTYVVLTTKGQRLPNIRLAAEASPIHQSLSPDGNKIAFEGFLKKSGEPQYGLYVYNVDTEASNA